MKAFEFRPKLFTALKNYSKELFMADLMAGIIVGIVALPLAIAFGIASGVSPEKGIITAIIAGFIISMLGGSKVQIGGPTGAFIVIIYGIIQQYGEAGLIVATLMAGVILILLGIFKLGAVIKFIPYPIIVGFTSGIAVTIFTTQIADIFGLNFGGEKVPGDFVGKWMIYFQHFDTINWWNTIVSIVSIAIIAITPKFSKKIPGSLIAIIVVTVAVYLMKTYAGINCIDTIGDRFSIKAELPDAVMPSLNWEAIQDLFPVAITIAVLGAIESLLSCVVADSMISSHHRCNMELVAQGVGNIGSILFGGIPATGAIARTAANVDNGGRTPISGMVHAVVLLLMLVFLMPYAALIPMPTIAAILLQVAYNMSGWRNFAHLCKTASKGAVATLLLTFALTIVFDLVTAIGIGMVITIVLFMKMVSEETEVKGWKYYCDANSEVTHLRELPKSVRVYEINGPMFFGMTDRITDISVKSFTKYLIIRMRGVPSLDASGMNALENLYDYCTENGVKLIFSHANEQPMKTMRRAGFVDLVGEEHFRVNIDDAIEHARELIEQEECKLSA